MTRNMQLIRGLIKDAENETREIYKYYDSIKSPIPENELKKYDDIIYNAYLMIEEELANQEEENKETCNVIHQLLFHITKIKLKWRLWFFFRLCMLYGFGIVYIFFTIAINNVICLSV